MCCSEERCVAEWFSIENHQSSLFPHGYAYDRLVPTMDAINTVYCCFPYTDNIQERDRYARVELRIHRCIIPSRLVFDIELLSPVRCRALSLVSSCSST